MKNDLIIRRLNAVFSQLICESSILNEIADVFTFTVPNFKFMKSKFSASWDGKIRLVNMKKRTIYNGLIHEVEKFCKIKEYTYSIENDYVDNTEITDLELNSFLNKVKLPKELHGSPFNVRDYQLETLKEGIRTKNKLFLSPTASGKSLMIYLLLRWFEDKKILIVVPTITLVHQMASDFEEYGGGSDYHKIYAGQEKEDISSRVVISTWQSLYKQPSDWFAQFDMVIGDEAHLYKAVSLKHIMESLVNADLRFGFTGTLDGTLTNELVLKGLFGPIHQVTTIKNLVEKKQISNFQIKTILLDYSNETKQNFIKSTYQDEIDFLISNAERNKFIVDLCVKMKGNTLLFFQYVDKHGKILEDMVRKAVPENRKVYFISGEISGEERNKIRELVENDNDCIIVASFGTTSTGINIRKIRNLVFASPSKSRIKILQSIGRGLRLSKDDSIVTVYDIADNLTKGKRINYTLEHMKKRIEIYIEEEFIYKMYKVQI